jgi:hypothetical protein
MGTQQDKGVPLFLLRRDLFFRTSSSLFACISWLRCDIERRRRQALTATWRRASGTSRVVLLRTPLGVLCLHTPEACRISVRISPRHPAADNKTSFGYSTLKD